MLNINHHWTRLKSGKWGGLKGSRGLCVHSGLDPTAVRHLRFSQVSISSYWLSIRNRIEERRQQHMQGGGYRYDKKQANRNQSAKPLLDRQFHTDISWLKTSIQIFLELNLNIQLYPLSLASLVSTINIEWLSAARIGRKEICCVSRRRPFIIGKELITVPHYNIPTRKTRRIGMKPLTLIRWTSKRNTPTKMHRYLSNSANPDSKHSKHRNRGLRDASYSNGAEVPSQDCDCKRLKPMLPTNMSQLLDDRWAVSLSLILSLIVVITPKRETLKMSLEQALNLKNKAGWIISQPPRGPITTLISFPTGDSQRFCSSFRID